MALLAVRNMAQPKTASMAMTATTCQSCVGERQTLKEGDAGTDREDQYDLAAEAIGDRTAGDLDGQAGQDRQADDQTHRGHRDSQAGVQVDRLEGVADLVADR